MIFYRKVNFNRINNLNWNIHTDNNLIHYDNRTLKERFPEKEKIVI